MKQTEAVFTLAYIQPYRTIRKLINHRTSQTSRNVEDQFRRHRVNLKAAMIPKHHSGRRKVWLPSRRGKQIIRERGASRRVGGGERRQRGDKWRQGETRRDACVLLAFHVREVSSLPLTAFPDALCRVARPQENGRETENPMTLCPRRDDHPTESRRLRTPEKVVSTLRAENRRRYA